MWLHAAIQDDIIGFGRSVAEHVARFQQVLETIEKSGLKPNKKKCEIQKPKICYSILEMMLAKKG